MKRKRRYGGDEINLTPLLDVLFVVLFTILLSGFSQQSQSNNQIDEMSSQIDSLQEQVSQYKDQSEAYDMYAKQAVILSVDNIKRNNQHVLRICKDSDVKEIVMGSNNTGNVKRQIESYIAELLDELNDQPIYIVFTCDEDIIYTVEYNAIDDVLKSLESKNKEVFYKTKEGE